MQGSSWLWTIGLCAAMILILAAVNFILTVLKVRRIEAERAAEAETLRRYRELGLKPKQVIVMRDRFPHGNGGTFAPRKGKLVAQGSHAAAAFLVARVLDRSLPVTLAMREWMTSERITKICVRAESLEELMAVHGRAKAAGLEVHLITDSGLTEFREPTVTCLAIGPDWPDKIDPVTGSLELL